MAVQEVLDQLYSNTNKAATLETTPPHFFPLLPSAWFYLQYLWCSHVLSSSLCDASCLAPLPPILLPWIHQLEQKQVQAARTLIASCKGWGLHISPQPPARAAGGVERMHHVPPWAPVPPGRLPRQNHSLLPSSKRKCFLKTKFGWVGWDIFSALLT